MDPSNATAMEVPVVAQHSRHWICAGQFFSTSVLIVPGPHAASNEPIPVAGNIYDCDGEIVNQFQTSVTPHGVACLELEPLMEGCKLESGLRHGQVSLETPAGFSHYCRFVGGDGAFLMGTPFVLSRGRSAFFPITFGEARSHIVCLVNHSEQKGDVKCRLFLKNRTPDIVCSVPGNGTRLINVESHFLEYLADLGDSQLAYLRMISKGREEIGVQLIERSEGKSDAGLFQSVS